MAGFNTFNRLWTLEGSIPNAIAIGFIPAASYAYGAKRYKRIILLMIHNLWICIIWCSFTMLLTVGFPRQISSIFSKTPEYLDWSEIIVRNGNVLTCICEFPGVITALLQATQHGGIATVLSFIVNLASLPIIAVILFYTDKTNIPRLLYSYPIQIAFGVFVSIPFAIYILRSIIKLMNMHTESKNRDIILNSLI